MAGLNCLFSFFFGPNADSLFDIGNKNLAVADFSCLGGLNDGGDGIIQLGIADDDFKFDFRQEVHCVFAPAINLGVPFLPAKPFDLTDCHAFDSYFTEGVFNLFQFEWFYYGFDFFHRLRYLSCGFRRQTSVP